MVKFNKPVIEPKEEKDEKQTPIDSELTLDAIDSENKEIHKMKKGTEKSNLVDLIGIINDAKFQYSNIPIPIDAIQWLIHSVKRQYKNKKKSIAGWVMINQVSRWIESYNLSRQ